MPEGEISDDKCQAVYTNTVQVKLPPFFKTQPQRWFTQAEAQFELRKITEESTKYCYVLQALDEESNARVSEYTDIKPKNSPYTQLKKALLAEFKLSELERAQAFFTLQSPSLATKPSDIMNQLIQFGPTTEPPSTGKVHETECVRCKTPSCYCRTREFLFKNIFLLQLPASIRTQMADHNYDVDSPRAFARTADKYWQALKEHQKLAASSELTEPAEVAGVNKRPQPPKPQPVETCWYHRKHGANAQKCTGSCNWSKNGKGGSRG